MKNDNSISVFDTFRMGKEAFKKGEPEVPEMKLGFLQKRDFLRGWNHEYFANLRKITLEKA